jgi:hypothetical protein
MVWQDMAGLTTGQLPRFVKRYASMHDALLDAARRYTAVRTVAAAGSIPAAQAAPGARGHSPSWRITKNISADNYLFDVVATGPGNARAAGKTSKQTAVVYHWQHGRRKATPLAGPAPNFAENIAASSASTVWVVLANLPVVDHYNGHRWTATSFAAKAQVLVGR